MASPGSWSSGRRGLAVAALALTLLTACKSAQPASAGRGGLTPIAATPSTAAAPSAAPSPTLALHAPITRKPTATPQPTLTAHPPAVRVGDLTISLASSACGFYSDTSGGLWLNPKLVVGWTGAGPFPSANLGFNMTTNYGKAGAGGPVSSTTPFTWAIGGEPAVGNAWLGQTVKITATLVPDPGTESNPNNDVTIITVAVPSPLPFVSNGSNGDYTIPCSATRRG